MSSTNIPLPAGITFYGLMETLGTNCESISINIHSDVGGILRVFFYAGPSALVYEHTYTYIGGTYEFISVGKKNNLFKIEYTNGPTPQTFFQLRTNFNDYLYVDDPASSSGGTSNVNIVSSTTTLQTSDSNLIPLQYEKNEYNLTANTILAPDTIPQYTAPPNYFPSEGWYYKNTALSQASQLYFYSYLNLSLAVPSRQKAFTISQITNSYAVVRILNINATLGLPFMAIYSRPSGSGDYQPWYRSKWVYTIPATSGLNQGQEVLIWWGTAQPNTKLHPNITRIQLQLSSTFGPALLTEELAYLTLNTDSSALVGNAEYIIKYAGFTADNIYDTEFLTGSSSSVVSVSNFPSTQNISGSVKIVDVANNPQTFTNVGLKNCSDTYLINQSLDTHCYGSSDGTTWHHLKTNPTGVLSTNAMVETNNGTLTSTVNGTINALDVQIKNSTITTVSQPSNSQSVGTSLTFNKPYDTINPSSFYNAQIGTSVSTTGFLNGAGLVQITSTAFSNPYSYPNIYLQASPDNTNWFDLSSYSFNTTGFYNIQAYNVILYPYLRLYVKFDSIMQTDTINFSCNAWIVQK